MQAFPCWSQYKPNGNNNSNNLLICDINKLIFLIYRYFLYPQLANTLFKMGAVQLFLKLYMIISKELRKMAKI